MNGYYIAFPVKNLFLSAPKYKNAHHRTFAHASYPLRGATLFDLFLVIAPFFRRSQFFLQALSTRWKQQCLPSGRNCYGFLVTQSELTVMFCTNIECRWWLEWICSRCHQNFLHLISGRWGKLLCDLLFRRNELSWRNNNPLTLCRQGLGFYWAIAFSIWHC